MLVLLLRDYLGFGATKTGWLFTYIGVCIILVQFVLINVAVRFLGEVGTVAFGVSLLLVGQGLTVLMSLGFMAGANYPLVQIVITTTAVCFGFGFSNPALSAAASNAAGKATMGGAHFPFGFGACITSLLLLVVIVLKRRPAMQPQCRQP